MLKRQIEIFSAGCPVCEETVQLVRHLACDACEVTILDVREPETAKRAASLWLRSVPAVVVNGALAACCEQGPTEAGLRAVGIGQPL